MSADPFAPPISIPRPSRLWPSETDAAASRSVMASALALGFLAALILRPQVPGTAFLFVGLGVLAVGVGARTGRLSGTQVGAAVVTVALLGVTALRSAPWLVVLCLLTAWVVGTLALVGARTWSGLIVGGLATGLVPARAAAWVRRTAATLRLPGLASRRAWLVVAVTGGLVAVFGALFATADPAYAALLGSALPSLDLPDIARRLLLFATISTAALVAAYLGHEPPAVDALAPPSGLPVRRWEWVVPLVVLDLLFLSFVVVQLTVLFGGRAHVLATQGLTYAQYARQGFWQLLIVTGLTLAVVAVAVRKAPRTTASDQLIVRVLLALLCLLALVVVGSALHRMSVYEQAYGFTRLRLFVKAVELTLGATFVLLLLAGIKMTGTWLPRAFVALASVALIGLAALNPDAYIAHHNVTRYEQTGRIDVTYLASLSPDAVPALVRLPGELRGCALQRLASEVRETADPWYDFNVARMRARRVLTGHPIRDCPAHVAQAVVQANP